MMRRIAALVILALGALALGPIPPASAEYNVVIHGSMTFPHWCGGLYSDGTLDGSATGLVDTSAVVEGAVHGDFTYNEPASTCGLSGTASGHLSGAVNADFNLTHVGPTGVMTLSTGAVCVVIIVITVVVTPSSVSVTFSYVIYCST